jgi:hypothetical protein
MVVKPVNIGIMGRTMVRLIRMINMVPSRGMEEARPGRVPIE